MIKQANYLGHQVGAILVEGRSNENGEGCFRAYVEVESADRETRQIIQSTSKKGLYVATGNLCRKLDKHFSKSYSNMPSKWQVYGVNPETLQQGTLIDGYLPVTEWNGRFVAELRTPTFSMDGFTREDLIREEIVNSVMDAVSKSGFGALGNLFHNFHYHGLDHTINSMVLDSLAASFFFPAAFD